MDDHDAGLLLVERRDSPAEVPDVKLSDCPYAVGTPEHSAWVQTVYVPDRRADPEFMAQERQRAGAESIGREAITGPTATVTVDIDIDAVMADIDIDAVMAAIRDTVGALERWQTATIDRWSRPDAAVRCPRHGEPKARCRPCSMGQ